MSKFWKFYYPDDGDTIEDASEAPSGSIRHADAESVAQFACEFDYSDRDGWERRDEDFTIAVVAPDGTETRFIAHHEPSVEHYVRKAS